MIAWRHTRAQPADATIALPDHVCCQPFRAETRLNQREMGDDGHYQRDPGPQLSDISDESGDDATQQSRVSGPNKRRFVSSVFKVELICPCGSVFERPYAFSRRFCSLECVAEYRASHMSSASEQMSRRAIRDNLAGVSRVRGRSGQRRIASCRAVTVPLRGARASPRRHRNDFPTPRVQRALAGGWTVTASAVPKDGNLSDSIVVATAGAGSAMLAKLARLIPHVAEAWVREAGSVLSWYDHMSWNGSRVSGGEVPAPWPSSICSPPHPTTPRTSPHVRHIPPRPLTRCRRAAPRLTRATAAAAELSVPPPRCASPWTRVGTPRSRNAWTR